MPRGALRPCAHAGCGTLVKSGRCSRHTDNAIVRDPHTKRLYNSPRWQRIRAEQLSKYPCCADCVVRGEIVRATEVDHIYPHRGDAEMFFRGPFQSMCKHHHSSKTKLEVMF